MNILKGFGAILLFIQSGLAFGQPSGKVRVIHLDTVVDRLMSAERIERLNQAYDYTAVLLLDSSLIELVEKTGDKDFAEFRDYARGLDQSAAVASMQIDKADLGELFSDEGSLIEMLQLLHSAIDTGSQMPAMVFPVYIGENRVVFETASPQGSDLYFGTLENSILRILWLGGAVE